MQPEFDRVSVLDLLLNRDNPRHEPKNNQEEIIDYLLGDEEVYNLARHMSAHGINPLEVVAVFKDDDDNLIVAEGNRRICAAQLLTDTGKSPEKDRKRFEALFRRGMDVSKVNIAIFQNYEAARPWLQVLHDGEQDGIGRRRWKPAQKARATTNKSNDSLAVALLDYAEKQNVIDEEFRKNIQISTVTRYLANPVVRNALGLKSLTTSSEIEIFTDIQRFLGVLTHFLSGVHEKRLHSRSKTDDWQKYADEVNSEFGTPPVPLATGKIIAPHNEVTKPLPQKGKIRLANQISAYIKKDSNIINGLNLLQSPKISSIYKSITSLKLEDHPALVTTGAWMLVESLTALHGRNANTDFVSYLNGKFSLWGIGRDQGKDCKLSLEYISQHGNAQKHSAIFTAMDARNLNNHFEVLADVFVALINDCTDKKKN